MKRRDFFKKAGIGSAALASLPALGTLAKPAQADEQEEGRERKFSWNIGSRGTVARASDRSTITLNGTGTFVVGDPDEVTGGGTWKLSTGQSGEFRVTSFIRFDLAPGSLPPPDQDLRAGLAFLRITYSDGSKGILVASCHLPGTPDSVSEGATASKGFTNYGSGVSGAQFFVVIREPEAE